MAPGSSCSPGRSRPRRAARRCSTRRRRGRHRRRHPRADPGERRSSPTSASSSSTSSTVSASSSATRCAARRRPPPHLLVMTATPIPRTVAMTVFGDLETSTLTELPAGPGADPHHVVVAAEQPAWLDRRLAAHPRGGRRRHQAYVVCPRIGDAADAPTARPDAASGAAEDDESADRPRAVLDVLAELADGPSLHGLRLGAAARAAAARTTRTARCRVHGRRDRRAGRDHGGRGRRRRRRTPR